MNPPPITPPTAAATPEFSPVRLTRRADGRLVLHGTLDGNPHDVPVQAACCFPWSGIATHISLRDDKGNEQVLIDDLATLSAECRALVEEELARRLFIPRITAVLGIRRRAELFHWQVETSAGPRSFLTAQGEHPRSLGSGRTLIKDVASDLYLVDDPDALDARSRRLLWAYLD